MIYLDYNATTPLLPEVWDAMQPFFVSRWGNPSSAYRFGAQLKAEIDGAREAVAALVAADPNEVIFTSCATESNNAAISAALNANPNKRHIITSLVEHSAVLNYCKAAEKRGYRVSYLSVDGQGRLDLSTLEDSITDETAVVSLMWANNETGVISPIKKISEICQSKGALFHCDAVQAAGKTPTDLNEIYIDYLSLSAHKIYGPKGIGALVVRNGSPFEPMIFGGHQEDGRRGGTENVGLIVGFSVAASLAKHQLNGRIEQAKILRDELEKQLLRSVSGSQAHGSQSCRVTNTTNIGFDEIDSGAMVAFLDTKGVCVSSGSACLENALAPSHVILAMTDSVDHARQAIRFSVSHLTEKSEISAVVTAVQQGAILLRSS